MGASKDGCLFVFLCTVASISVCNVLSDFVQWSVHLATKTTLLLLSYLSS